MPVPKISSLYLYDLAAGKSLPLPPITPGVTLDPATLPAAWTIGADVTGAFTNVLFHLTDAAGVALIKPDPNRGNKPPLLTREALNLAPGTYTLAVTAFGGPWDKNPSPTVTVPFTVAAPAPVPTWPPVVPVPADAYESNTTDFGKWNAGRFVMRRGVEYLAVAGKTIGAGSSMSIEAEAGSGPPPKLRFANWTHSAFDFLESSAGFALTGPVLIDGGGSYGGVASFFRVRGSGHTFNQVWLGRGGDGWFGDGPEGKGGAGVNGTADITLTDCGCYLPVRGNLIYTSDGDNSGVTHSRWNVTRFKGLPMFSSPSGMANSHGIRIYGFRDWTLRDILLDLRASQWISTGAMRLHSGDGLRLEASSLASTLLTAPSYNYLGALNKPDQKGPRPVANVYFGPGVRLSGHWQLHYGVSNFVWDGIDFHGDNNYPIGIEHEGGADGLGPYGQAAPTGTVRNSHFYFEAKDGPVLEAANAAAMAGVVCTNTTATNPKKGWVNVPLGADFRPAK